MFHSVQLNVNNPHFLIMQGRITKVLNMKPPEILGLLEEAAGTKMYETKKQAALRTLEKKQIKVDEINKVRVGKLLIMNHCHLSRHVHVWHGRGTWAFDFNVCGVFSWFRFCRKISCLRSRNFVRKRYNIWSGRMRVPRWRDCRGFVWHTSTPRHRRTCLNMCGIY